MRQTIKLHATDKCISKYTHTVHLKCRETHTWIRDVQNVYWTPSRGDFLANLIYNSRWNNSSEMIKWRRKVVLQWFQASIISILDTPSPRAEAHIEHFVESAAQYKWARGRDWMSAAIGNSFPIRKMEVVALLSLSWSHSLFLILTYTLYICVIHSLALSPFHSWFNSKIQRQLNGIMIIILLYLTLNVSCSSVS